MRPGSCDSRSGDGGYRVAVLFNGGMDEGCAFSATFRPCMVSAIFIRGHHEVLLPRLDDFPCPCSMPISRYFPEVHPLWQSLRVYLRDAEGQPLFAHEPAHLVVKPKHPTAQLRVTDGQAFLKWVG